MSQACPPPFLSLPVFVWDLVQARRRPGEHTLGRTQIFAGALRTDDNCDLWVSGEEGSLALAVVPT